MRSITRIALTAALGITAQAAAQNDPSASISFVTNDEIEAGEVITIDVVCDFDTQTTDAGLFGAPGLYLFACNIARVTGNTASTGSITIDPAFPTLQSPGEYAGASNARFIAGCVGNASGVAMNPVTLFSFQQRIAADASDGDQIVLAYEGAVVFDAGGELFSIGSTGTNAYALTASSTTLTVGPTAPTSCNAADIATPFDVLDLADINLFLNSFTGNDPVGDLNGDTLFDLTDINLFIAAFTGGCP